MSCWSKKMTKYLGIVNFYTKVAYDHNITNYMSKGKMTGNRIYKFVRSIFINHQIFQWTPKILKLFIVNIPSYLLKVTKFLIKISQFELIVRRDKILVFKDKNVGCTLCCFVAAFFQASALKEVGSLCIISTITIKY